MSQPRTHALYYAAQERNAARDGPFARELTTPEGARLPIRLASAGERAGAFLIDMILLVLTLFLGSWLFRLVFAGTGDAEQIGVALFGLFVFVVRNFYFILFEGARRAATPGKRLVGLRVAMRDGSRLSTNAILARNLVREVEIFLPVYFFAYLVAAGMSDGDMLGWTGFAGVIWSGVFLLFPVFNRDRLRLGDLIAGTWVVHNPKPVLNEDVAGSGQSGPDFAFTRTELDAYGIHELQVLEDILRQSQADVKSSVADRIRKKISRSRVPGESDEAFLKAYYAALRRHLEGGLALGRAKRHKFDK